MTSPGHRDPPVKPLRPVRLLAVTFLGGSIGSLARIAAEVAFADAGWPAWGSRMLVNGLGAFLIGCLFARIAVRGDDGAPSGIPHSNRMTEHLLGAGFLGGFTTVSGMAWDIARSAVAGDAAEAACVLAVNAVAGIVAAALGWRIVRSDRARSGAERAR